MVTNTSSRRRRHPSGVVCALVVCVGMVCGGCEKPQELVRADTEKEANRILVELARRGIGDAQKAETKEQRKTVWSITVPAGELTRAREVLVACELPREGRGGFKSMAEQGGLIPTKTEERAKFVYAMSEELARTFETYDRVVAARVHIALPERDPLRRDATTRPTASATVMIKYNALLPGEASGAATQWASREAYADVPVKAQDVQQIVARSVEGLTPDSVFVAYSRSAPVTPPAAAATATTAAPGGDSEQTNRKLFMQLLGVAALFGLISIFLTTLLVREKRRQRMTALAPFTEPTMEHAGT